MSEKNTEAAVKALIEKNSKILMLKAEISDWSMWIPPGGRVEFGESPMEALHREIEEETGMDIQVQDCIGMYHFFKGPDDNGSQIVTTVFRTTTSSKTVDINSNPDEDYITGYQWVKPEKLVEKNITDSLADLVKEYYELD